MSTGHRAGGDGTGGPPDRRRRVRTAVTLVDPFRRENIPAEPTQLIDVRRALADWARSAGLSPSTAADLVLASYEAMANATEHAYRDGTGTIDVLVTSDDAEVTVLVRDHGAWRPPPADPGHRGRGLLMIRSLSRAEVVAGPDGTTVRMRWPREA
jgi:serine/threonine-protein kinase RsbW